MISLILAATTTLSLLFFLFQMFRNLRRDYPEEEIVRASALGLLIAIPGCLLVAEADLRFFVALLTTILVVYFFSLQSKWHFWATLEALTTPGLIAVLLIQLSKQVLNFSLFELGRGAAYFLTLLSGLYWRNYRRFSWYPSGKSGFFFLASLGTLALLMIPLDFWQRRLLELGIWAMLLTSSVVMILLLSGREREEKLIVDQRRIDGQKES